VDVETTSRDELKAELDRGDDFKLVMTLNEWAFTEAHIPGSINVTSPALAARQPGEAGYSLEGRGTSG
jgi:hypothetical protein